VESDEEETINPLLLKMKGDALKTPLMFKSSAVPQNSKVSSD
jgi:hypothetical protein